MEDMALYDERERYWRFFLNNNEGGICNDKE